MKHFYTTTGVIFSQIQNSPIFLLSEHIFNILNMNFYPVQLLIGNLLQCNAVFQLSQSSIALIFRDNHLWIFIVHQEKGQSFFHIIHGQSFTCLSKHFFRAKIQYKSIEQRNCQQSSSEQLLEKIQRIKSNDSISTFFILQDNYKKTKKIMFKKGDYVFAGTSGHIPYPAKITKVDVVKGYYHVSFINYRSTSVVEASALEDFNQNTIQKYQKLCEGSNNKQQRGVLRSIKVAESLLSKIPKGFKKRVDKDKNAANSLIKMEDETKKEQNNDQISFLLPQSDKVKLQKEDSSCKSTKKIPLTIHIRTRNQIKFKESASNHKIPKLEYIQTISSSQSSKNSDIFNCQSSNIRSLYFNQYQQLEVKDEKDSQKSGSLQAIEQINEYFQSYEQKQKFSHQYQSSLINGLNNIQQDDQFNKIQKFSQDQQDLHDLSLSSSLDDNFSDDENTLDNIPLNKQLDHDPHKENDLYYTRNLEEGDMQGLLQIMDQQFSISGENNIKRKMQTLNKYLKIQLHRIKVLEKSVEKTENPLDMHKRQIFTSIIYDNSLSFKNYVEHKSIYLLFDFVFKYQECLNKLKECMMGEYFIARSTLNIFFITDKWKQQICHLGYEEVIRIEKQVFRYRNRVVCTRKI